MVTISLGFIGLSLTFDAYGPNADDTTGPIVTQAIFTLGGSVALSLFVISVSRWRKLPYDDRRIAGFSSQVLSQLIRYAKELLASWFSVAFDLALPLLTGLMTGALVRILNCALLYSASLFR